ncbi:addiction module protein [Pedobacter helvus]|uniref:Addiction module protein n=1 Tax=Pedobacter helvus TaxID=2563444 RepID=A0ABW9JHI2_9SPHI|nr:addiction module protein [Pedobacter ureilyticus]
MDTTFRFSSAQQITEEFIEKLRSFYKDVPISITVQEDFQIPEWQKEVVLKRQQHIKNHPQSLVDFDEMMLTLEQEVRK